MKPALLLYERTIFIFLNMIIIIIIIQIVETLTIITKAKWPIMYTDNGVISAALKRRVIYVKRPMYRSFAIQQILHGLLEAHVRRKIGSLRILLAWKDCAMHQPDQIHYYICS